MRARWALINADIKTECIEVDLHNKQQEIFTISSKGTVPILITNENKIIDESLDIMIWAINNSHLLNQDQLINKFKNNAFKLIVENDRQFKFHLDRYKYSSRYKKDEEDYHKDAALEILGSWEKMIKSNSSKNHIGYLLSKENTIADWAIWPFVRQFRIACESKESKSNLPEYLNYWIGRFEQCNKFKKIMNKSNKIKTINL